MESYIFDGNTGQTYADIQKRRKAAEQFGRSVAGPLPRTAIDGVGSVVDALLGRHNAKKADRMQGELLARLGPGHPIVMALLGIPQGVRSQMEMPAYRNGTGYHRGGPALVGEDGPEAVMLPPGAQVLPADGTQDPAFLGEFLNLSPQERARTIERMQQGMPPAEAIMPEGYDPREMIGPQSSFDDSRAYRTADLDAFKLMKLQPQYEELAPNDANSNEARRLQLLRRAMFADAALEDPRLGQAMTRIDNSVASNFGALGRLYTDDNYELGRLMAEQFASAILRGDSGAETPEPEVQRYVRQYFPLPNETPEQVQAKKAMRREEIRALIQSLPDDARPVAEQIQREIDALRQQADVPDGSLTGGATAQPPAPAAADGWTEVNGVRIRVKR